MSWTSFIQLLIGIVVGGIVLCIVLVGVIELAKTLREKKGE